MIEFKKKTLCILFSLIFLIGIVSAIPFDISTAFFDNISISTQDAIPLDLFFKPDGTRFFEAGAGSDAIFEYDCSDAWNLSSCVHNNKSISSQGTAVSDLFFKPDGTRFFEADVTANRIFQSDCSDAWNISSCVFGGVNLSALSGVRGLHFKPDGTKMFEIGFGQNAVFEYECSDAWNLSSCVHTNVNISNIGVQGLSLSFKPDGTRFFQVSITPTTIYQLDCSVAWNLSSCVYNNVSFGLQGSATNGLSFKPDGTRFFQSDTIADVFYQYSLPLAPFPEIDFVVPTEANDTTFFSRDFITINVSVNLTDEDTITFHLLDSGFNTIFANQFTNGLRTLTFTPLVDATYNYFVEVNDSTGQLSQTPIRKITIFNLAQGKQPLFPNEIQGDGVIYDTMRSGGAGLSLFMSNMAQSLPLLLIVLVMVGIIVVVAFGIGAVIRKRIQEGVQ